MKRAVCLGPIMLAGALFITGCNGGSPAAAATAVSTTAAPPAGPSAAQQLAKLEDEGELPKLDRSESVAGPDTDGNGVRDDIDAYLRQRFGNEEQHAAAIQMAKAMQSAVVAGGGNPDASAEADEKINNAIHCLYARFKGSTGNDHPAAVSDEIEAITANTKPRLLAYLAYDKSRDGTTSSLPLGDTCEAKLQSSDRTAAFLLPGSPGAAFRK